MTTQSKDTPLEACDDCGETVLEEYLEDGACPECRSESH
jgi:rubredoxin